MHKSSENGENLNPGGSLGSKEFAFPDFNSVEEIEAHFIKNNGYEYSNNIFFSNELKDKSVAEVGCGHGLISVLLASRCKSLIGYDVDKEAIVYATALGKKLKLDNIKFKCYSGVFSSNEQTYDIVISMDVIEHVNNPIDYLRNLYQILKPGGILILGTPNGLIANGNKCIVKTHSKFHVMEYTPSELLSFLDKTGFTIEACFSNKNVNGGGYKLSPARKSLIKILCLLHLFDTVSTILKFFRNMKGKNKGINNIEKNSINDWVVKPILAKDINNRNCDVIIFKANRQ